MKPRRTLRLYLKYRLFLGSCILVIGIAHPGFVSGQSSTQNASQNSSHSKDKLRFARWAFQDAGPFLVHVGKNTPAVALGSTILLSSSKFDPAILQEVQEDYSGPVASYLDLANELGGPRVVAPVAGLFATSLLTRNEKFQDAAYTSFEALVYAGALTVALKTIIGRYRPEENRGSFRFEPLSGNSSFPSGHTTAAFAIVTPWVLYYKNSATYGLFALSASTAVARVAVDKHWPTDVLAGAAVGFFTARFLTIRHKSVRVPRHDVSISPVANLDRTGLTLSYRF